MSEEVNKQTDAAPANGPYEGLDVESLFDRGFVEWQRKNGVEPEPKPETPAGERPLTEDQLAALDRHGLDVERLNEYATEHPEIGNELLPGGDFDGRLAVLAARIEADQARAERDDAQAVLDSSIDAENYQQALNDALEGLGRAAELGDGVAPWQLADGLLQDAPDAIGDFLEQWQQVDPWAARNWASTTFEQQQHEARTVAALRDVIGAQAVANAQAESARAAVEQQQRTVTAVLGEVERVERETSASPELARLAAQLIGRVVEDDPSVLQDEQSGREFVQTAFKVARHGHRAQHTAETIDLAFMEREHRQALADGRAEGRFDRDAALARATEERLQPEANGQAGHLDFGRLLDVFDREGIGRYDRRNAELDETSRAYDRAKARNEAARKGQLR